jgi:heme A synthase
MTTLMVELLVAGLIVVLVALLARLAWVARRRRRLLSVTEVQARENAAPLTTAILASDRRERTGL